METRWNRLLRIAAGVVLLCGATAAIAQQHAVSANDERVGRAAAQVSPASDQSGMRAYVNPATGAFEAPPALGAERSARFPDLNNSVRGLAATSGPTLTHGRMIDLQGRFQHAITATIDSTGAVETQCDQAATGPVVAPTCHVAESNR